jgi:hypothetical protein
MGSGRSPLDVDDDEGAVAHAAAYIDPTRTEAVRNGVVIRRALACLKNEWGFTLKGSVEGSKKREG